MNSSSTTARRGLKSLLTVIARCTLAACGGGSSDDGDAGVSDSRLMLAAAPALPSGAAPVPALTYSCGNVTLGSARSGEIEVPAGQVCVLQGTYVDGNIKLNRGSVLDARDVTRIGRAAARELVRRCDRLL